MTSAEAASWVQAIGSILAILSSFAFVLFQQRQTRYDRARVLLELSSVLITHAAVTKGTLHDSKEDKEAFAQECRNSGQAVAAHREVLLALDLSPVVGKRVWVSLSLLVANMDRFISMMDEIEKKVLSGRSPANLLGVAAIHTYHLVDVSQSLSHAIVETYGVKLESKSELSDARVALDVKKWSDSFDADEIAAPVALRPAK